MFVYRGRTIKEAGGLRLPLGGGREDLRTTSLLYERDRQRSEHHVVNGLPDDTFIVTENGCPDEGRTVVGPFNTRDEALDCMMALNALVGD